MTEGIDLLHKVLDGEASREETETFLSLLDADHALRKEYDALKATVFFMENSGKMPVPASFTGDVMKKLPRPEKADGKSFWGFLFGERVLRWNMASALATAALLAVVLGGIVRFSGNLSRVMPPSNSVENVNRVTFTLHAPDAREVAVAGEFNQWSVEGGKMKKRENGVWTVQVPLKPGTYNYMFVVDGKVWVADPKADSFQDDGFGNKNSVIRIKNL